MNGWRNVSVSHQTVVRPCHVLVKVDRIWRRGVRKLTIVKTARG